MGQLFYSAQESKKPPHPKTQSKQKNPQTNTKPAQESFCHSYSGCKILERLQLPSSEFS